MAVLSELVKQSGLNPITCSHCGKRTKTGGVIKAFFRMILEKVKKGEKVRIDGFGVFYTTERKGGRFAEPLMGVEEFPPYLVFRFRASALAKKFLKGRE